MRIFKTKWFDRFARKERIDDASLLDAIDRAEAGLVDADLGGHLIKQRIARPGKGRSGGYRTIIVFKSRTRSFFVYGFAKSEKDNLSVAEEAAYKEAAEDYLSLTEDVLDGLAASGTLKEIERDG